MNIYDLERDYVDLKDGEQLAEFVRRKLLDDLFVDGGDRTTLIPAGLTDSVADIMGLDHGSVLCAAIEEALSCRDHGERSAFFEGLGLWFLNVGFENLASMSVDSQDAFNVLENRSRMSDVAAIMTQRRACVDHVGSAS